MTGGAAALLCVGYLVWLAYLRIHLLRGGRRLVRVCDARRAAVATSAPGRRALLLLICVRPSSGFSYLNKTQLCKT